MAEVKGYPVFKGTFVDHSGIGDTGLDVRIVNGFRDQFNTVVKRPALTENIANNGATGNYGIWNMYGIFTVPGTASDTTITHIAVLASGDSLGFYSIGTASGIIDAQPKVFPAELYITTVSGIEESIKREGVRHAVGDNSTSDLVSFLLVGGTIYMYNHSTPGTSILSDAALPSIPSDIAYINQRLVVSEKASQKIYYSNTGDPTDFTGGGSFEAESQTDSVTRIRDIGNDLYIFGETSVDIYYNSGDPTFPFARYDGSEVKIGLPWQYRSAMVEIDGVFYFADNRGTVSRLQGTTPEQISVPINSLLAKFYGEMTLPMPTEGVARLSNIKIDGRDLLVLTFPGYPDINNYAKGDSTPKGVSFAYDVNINDWYIWTDDSTLYDISSLNWYSAVYCPLCRRSFVADADKQKIAMLSFDTSDYSSNKETLVVTSANIDLGSHKRKSAHMMTARVKGTVGPTVQYREGPVSSPIATGTNPFYTLVSGETIDDEGTFMRVPRLGQYRVRQYRFTHSDNSAFSIGDVTEEVEVLGS